MTGQSRKAKKGEGKVGIEGKENRDKKTVRETGNKDESRQQDLSALLTNKNTDNEADRLEEEIRLHNRLYWVENHPAISDEAFDRMVERLQALRPDSPVLEQIGSGGAAAGAGEHPGGGAGIGGTPAVVVGTMGAGEQRGVEQQSGLVNTGEWIHRRPMLSLDKCYDQGGFFKWLDRLDRNSNVIVTPKIDGLACSIIYGHDGTITTAATRGDGTKGEVITAQAMTVAGISHKLPVGDIEVRGEVYMPLAVFTGFSDRFANPRNLAAGALKQKNPEKTAEYRLSFMAYDLVLTPEDGQVDARWQALVSTTADDPEKAGAAPDANKKQELPPLPESNPKQYGLFSQLDHNEPEQPAVQAKTNQTNQTNQTNTAIPAAPAGIADLTATQAFESDALPASEHQKLTILKQLGFSVVPHRLIPISARTEQEGIHQVFQEAYSEWSDSREQLEYEIDGVVFKADNLALQEQMGYTAHHPRYAIAWKLATESGLTPLVDVLWSVSRTGTVTPVAITEPVELSGATITRATLHNTTIFRQLGLSRGCILRIVRRGGVIPYVEAVEQPGGEPFVPPEVCPSCGVSLLEEGDFLRCPNNTGCPEQAIGRMEHYLKSVDVDGFGRAILEQLFKSGLARDIPDLYKLKAEDLMPLERMGEISANKLVNALNERNSLELSVFLQSLGIGNLGPFVAGILQREYGSLDSLRSQTSEDLANHFGIGKVTAEQIVSGLESNKVLIEALLEYITIQVPSSPETGADGASLPLAGKSFVFTGKLEEMTRAEAQRLVKAAGGSCPSDVVKDLDYLVVGGDELAENARQGNKLKKANKYNGEGASISIISEGAFMAMIGAGAQAKSTEPAESAATSDTTESVS